MTPAIRMAEEGVPIASISSVIVSSLPFGCITSMLMRTAQWQNAEAMIKRMSSNGHEMLINNQAPRPGEIYRNATLATTFRTLAKEGKEGFYGGRIGKEIVQGGCCSFTSESLLADAMAS